MNKLTITLLVIFFTPSMMGETKKNPVIPIGIDRVLTQSWPNGGGVYRVIAYNTEIEPCLILQSINLSTEKIMFSQKLCPKDYQLKNYYAPGRDLNLGGDIAGFYYDHIGFNKNIVEIKIDAFLLKGPELKVQCDVIFSQHQYQLKGCRKQVSNCETCVD